jgi:hypothetical protein
MAAVRKIVPVLLIILLITSIATITSIQAVKATNAALMFTPNYVPPGYPETQQELTYSDSVASMIMYYFQNYGGNYGYLYNCQDSAASQNQYISSLNYAQNNSYNTVVYSKGHEVPWGNGNYYELYPNDYNPNIDNGVKDSTNVYPNTGSSDRFVVLWHCGTAMSYYSTYNSNYGWDGMAYDFTHDNSMSKDGYGSHDPGVYVFIGFINYSEEYLSPTNYGSYNYGDFVSYFYMYLLQGHDTVNKALDYATAAVTQNQITTFGCWSFHTGQNEGGNGLPICWSQCVVYGDGNLNVPA